MRPPFAVMPPPSPCLRLHIQPAWQRTTGDEGEQGSPSRPLCRANMGSGAAGQRHQHWCSPVPAPVPRARCLTGAQGHRLRGAGRGAWWPRRRGRRGVSCTGRGRRLWAPRMLTRRVGMGTRRPGSGHHWRRRRAGRLEHGHEKGSPCAAWGHCQSGDARMTAVPVPLLRRREKRPRRTMRTMKPRGAVRRGLRLRPCPWPCFRESRPPAQTLDPALQRKSH